MASVPTLHRLATDSYTLGEFRRRFKGRQMRINTLTRKLDTCAQKLFSFFIVFHGNQGRRFRPLLFRAKLRPVQQHHPRGQFVHANSAAPWSQAAGPDRPRYARLLDRPNADPCVRANPGPGPRPFVRANPRQFLVANWQYIWSKRSRPALACSHVCPPQYAVLAQQINRVYYPPNSSSSRAYTKMTGSQSRACHANVSRYR